MVCGDGVCRKLAGQELLGELAPVGVLRDQRDRFRPKRSPVHLPRATNLQELSAPFGRRAQLLVGGGQLHRLHCEPHFRIPRSSARVFGGCFCIYARSGAGCPLPVLCVRPQTLHHEAAAGARVFDHVELPC